MTKTSETILFFGSGPVAAASLRLLARDFRVEAVVTRPRPAHHRGEVPVLETAEGLGLQVFTASDERELDKLFKKHNFVSPLGVLIDYGIIVSQKVIDYFPLGIINSHFSVLPEWRGADPISFAILSGQESTGVSLMQLTPKLDEGPLLAYGEYQLPPSVTTPELTEHLINFSHLMLKDVIPKYLKDNAAEAAKPGQPQSVSGRAVSYSRKLTKEDGELDFAKPADQLEREVRAYAGWPRSRTTIGNIDVVITRAHVAKGCGTPGKLWQQDKQLGVYTAKGVLAIDSLIPAGKKEMPVAAFLAGHQLHG